jgi:hypothetical protein
MGVFTNIITFKPVLMSHRERIAEQLADHLCLEIKSFLGKGLQGEAYLTNSGQVLKITNDEEEYYICTSLIGKNVKHIYKIYATYRLLVDGSTYFGILEERLNTSEEKLLDTFQSDSEFIPLCHKFIRGGLSTSELIGVAQKVVVEYPKYSFYVNQFILMAIASKEVGVTISDMHSGNVGRKGDHLVLFDLGYSGSEFTEEGETLSIFI